MTDLNRQFLEQIVVWPGAKEAPGWVNLHVHRKNVDPKKNGGKPFVVGWPFKTVDEFISRAAWAETTDSYFDSWYCTSQQSDTALNTAGKIKAVRLAKNATWLKAIWLDIDIKPDDETGKHYTSLKEAVDAFLAFRTKVGLPGPTALVNSGGGLHVYWISDTPLAPNDWLPYADGLKALTLAEGLKCDAGLTTDSVRLLRVPGTLNHKYDPPRRVTVLGGKLGRQYNYATDLLFLKNFKTSQTRAPGPGAASPAPVSVLEPGFKDAGMDAAFAALNPAGDALTAGIATRGLQLIDPTPVFKECGFLKHALTTGGVDYDQPLWNLSVLCTVFMEDGNDLAHAISAKHPTYSPPNTQALYDRKVADRVERGIGYPSCAAIEGAGCKACASCPLKPKGKSPLNIRAPVTATVTRTQSAGGAQLMLPDGYDIDNEGHICEITHKVARNGDVSEIWWKLFQCQIISARAFKSPDCLHLKVSTDKGNWTTAVVTLEDWSGPEAKLGTALGKQQVKFNPDHKGRLAQFFMSFLAEMHKHTATESVSYGWVRTNGQVDGFAYGGNVFHCDGTVTPASVPNGLLRDRYTPRGSIDPWYVAMSYITRQKRPELEVGVLVSFAAPLLDLTGTKAGLVSLCGERGAGKSYALEVGCAVWGHPTKTKHGAQSTQRSVLNAMGITGVLPCYWDEITEEPHQKQVLEAGMIATQGVEASRLNSAVEQRERGIWSTIMAISTNRMFRDYICKKQKDHGAALTRVLEYHVAKDVPNPVGQVPTSESDQALAVTMHNYGMVGMEYAALLATRVPDVIKTVNQNLRMFETKLHPDKQDRMWVGVLAALLSAAQLANQLPRPVGFDVPAIVDFLFKLYKDNKDYRDKSDTNPTQIEYAEDYLAQYLKEHQIETIWTKGAISGVGGKQNVEWHILNTNAPRPKSYNIRFDYLNQEIWVSQTNLKQWCELAHPDAGRNYRSIITAFRAAYGMTDDKRVLAGGTPWKASQERIFVIKVAGHQDLIDALYSQTGADNTALGQSSGAPPQGDPNENSAGQNNGPGPGTDFSQSRIVTGLEQAPGAVP